MKTFDYTVGLRVWSHRKFIKPPTRTSYLVRIMKGVRENQRTNWWRIFPLNFMSKWIPGIGEERRIGSPSRKRRLGRLAVWVWVSRLAQHLDSSLFFLPLLSSHKYATSFSQYCFFSLPWRHIIGAVELAIVRAVITLRWVVLGHFIAAFFIRGGPLLLTGMTCIPSWSGFVAIAYILLTNMGRVNAPTCARASPLLPTFPACYVLNLLKNNT